MNAPAKDYIRDFMTEPVVDPAQAALVIIDMQYATGSRQGALGRRMKAEGSNVTDYRFDRIEQLLVPNILRLRQYFRDQMQKMTEEMQREREARHGATAEA